MTPDAQSWALAALSWTMRGTAHDLDHMRDCVAELSPAARRDVLRDVSALEDELRAAVARDIAAAVLQPDALPVGAGFKVGVRLAEAERQYADYAWDLASEILDAQEEAATS